MRQFFLSFFIFLVFILAELHGYSQSSVYTDFQSKLLVYEPIFSNPETTTPPSINSQLIASICKGDSMFLKGKCNEACDFYKFGLQLCKKNKLTWPQVIFLNRLGFANYWTSHISKSFKYYSEAKKITSICDQIMDTIAYLETNFFSSLLNPANVKIDMINIGDMIEFAENEKYSTSRLAKFYYFKSEVYFRIGKKTEVLYVLKDMQVAIKQCTTSRAFWLFVERNEESDYYEIMDIIQISENFNRELAYQVMNQPEFKEFEYIVLNNLANNYYRTGKYLQAIEIYKRLMPFVEEENNPRFYNFYLSIGYCYGVIGDSAKPDIFYKKSEKLLIDYNIHDNRLARVYHFMAAVNPKINEYSQASLNYSLKAAKILEISPLPYLESYVYYRIGNYYYNKEIYPKAIEYYEHLLTNVDSLLFDSSYFRTQVPSLLRNNLLSALRWIANSNYRMARKYNDTVFLYKAYRDYQKLNILWAKLFDNLENYEAFKVDILKSIRENYSSQLDMGYLFYESTQNEQWFARMFSYSQSSKVFLLNSYLNDRIAQKISGIPTDSMEKSFRLKKELDELQYSQIISFTESKSKAGNDLIISNIIEKYKEYDSFIAHLEKEYPEYARHKMGDKGLSIKEIQDQLEDDQALIDYHIAFRGFYTFYIDKKNFVVKCHPLLTSFTEISDMCEEYYKLLTQNNSSYDMAIRDKELYTLSNKLYNILIAPVEAYIKNKRLIIVPDLELNMVPFETLMARIPGKEDMLKQKIPEYLILTNPISYLYSSSQIGRMAEVTIRHPRYAGFVPDYSRCGDIRPQNYYQQISQLPGALEEVTAAQVYFNGRIFNGKKATKDNFFKSLSHYEIVHLAMHTSIDEEEPMNSELIFTPDSTRQEEQLHAYEVYAHENNVQMVVLSACNTAKGRLEKGEGVFNIARAFFLAGIPNVIVTQWSVSDKSSANLMSSFYKYLSEGVPSDVALQKAKIDLLLKGDPVKKDPYYWSAYVSYGSSSFVPYKNYTIILIISAILISIVIAAFLSFRKKVRT